MAPVMFVCVLVAAPIRTGVALALETESEVDDVRAPTTEKPETLYGWLEVHSEPVGAEVSVDGEGEGPAPRRIYLLTGGHEVTLSMGGYISATRNVSIATEEEKAITVVLEPDPAFKFTTEGHIAFWGGLGLGAALACIGHVGATQSAHDVRAGDLDRLGANRTYSWLAVSGWIVAAVGMAVGVYMWSSPPRYRADGDMVCQTYRVTGSRRPQQICRPRSGR